MKDFLDKAPFVKLLPALLVGIFLQYYVGVSAYAFYILTFGVLLISASYLLPQKFRNQFHIIFGIGIFLLFAAFGVYSTHYQQEKTAFTFQEKSKAYIGTISEIPQPKSRSIACRVKLEDNFKHKVIVYFQPDSTSKTLQVGDKIMFYGQIQAFKNRGNPDDFDYARYITRMGFSGSLYLPTERWQKLESHETSIYTFSQQVRSKILEFYRSLNLGKDNFAIFSALTLGYKAELDSNIKQAFRASGVSHILCVSGLHVGIIYLVIASLLSFLPKSHKFTVFKQLLIFIFLWFYAFLTGLPPSVIRATTMISLFCIAIALKRKALTYNTVFFAAFVMLLINPFDFFNIGFQLSFAAVLSICFFLPHILKLYKPKNHILEFSWGIAAVSIAVQLGTYPICLYYFGTFPTYFFLTNIVIIPLTTLAMYSSIGVYLAALIACFFSSATHILIIVPVSTLKFLLSTLLRSATFFQKLPFALISEKYITIPQVFLLILLSISMILFLERRKAKTLMFGLSIISALLILSLPMMAKEKNHSIYIFNRSDKLEISKVGEQNFVSDTTNQSNLSFLEINQKMIAILKSDVWGGQKAPQSFKVDYLILSGKDSLSMYHLQKLFAPQLVILDGTLSSRNTRRLQRECKKLEIDCYDVKEKGAFRIKN